MKYTKTRILVFLLWYIPFFISATGDKFFDFPSCMMINWVGMSYPALAGFLLLVIPAIYFMSFAYRRFHKYICVLLCVDGAFGGFLSLHIGSALNSLWLDAPGHRAYFWQPFFDVLGLTLEENDLFKWGFWTIYVLCTLVVTANYSFLKTQRKTDNIDEDKKPSFIQQLREWRKHKTALAAIFVVISVFGLYFGKDIYYLAVESHKLVKQVEQEFTHVLEDAENGDVDAMAFVGFCYWNGLVTKYNTAEAVRWLEKGAQNGSADAMALLGGAYYTGYRTGRDWDKARYWLNAAIETEKTDPEMEYYARIVLDRIDKGLLPFQWDWTR